MKFSEIQLHPLLQTNLDKIQFVECTKVQEQAIPLIRQAKDVAGLAQTGTGKTGAFLIPLVDRLLKALKPVDDKGTDLSAVRSSSFSEMETVPEIVVTAAPQESGEAPDWPSATPKTDDDTASAALREEEASNKACVPFHEWKKKQFVLILVPTRELCDQVQEIATKLLDGTGLSSVAIYGGTTYDKQVAGLKRGAEFVVATPGRLIDLFKEHVADLGMVRAIVFDEADRMFDMGFKDDMKFILRRVPRERQFLVFSATLNFDVLNVAYEFGADPVEINISRDQAKADNVKDQIIHLGHTDKPQYLLSLLKQQNPRQAIIFSNFKLNVEKITRFLNSNGVPAVGISSLMTQGQRNRVMAQFKADNDRNILVATDLAARGLDILGVDLVINYELPDDPENYVHRIGRTGRAGQTGSALSLVSDRDVDALQRIEDYLKHKVEVMWLDDADLTKEFKAFPQSEDRFKRPGEGRRERFEGRGGGGERGGGGRSRHGGGRSERGGGRPDRGGGGRGPRGESHRDRHTGRHKGEGGLGTDAASLAAGGEGPRPRRDSVRGSDSASHQGAGQGQRRHGGTEQRGREGKEMQPRGPREDRSQRDREHQRRGGGGRQGSKPGGQGQRSGVSPHGRGGSTASADQHPHRHRHSGGGHRQQRPSGAGGGRPAAVSAQGQSQGLGAKVSGFFKKLFGG